MSNSNWRIFRTIVCYLIAAGLSLSPITHASIALFDGPPNSHAQVEEPCHQTLADGLNSSSHQHDSQLMDTSTDFDHGSTCKILCGVSVSVLQRLKLHNMSTEKSNRWVSFHLMTIYSSFLSRLDKPPRS